MTAPAVRYSLVRWFALEFPHDQILLDLRVFAMRILVQKAQELAAERHFSLTDHVQSKNRGKTNPGSLEKRCLFCSEVLQEIAECTAQATNHGLQTVDDAPQPPPPVTPTP